MIVSHEHKFIFLKTRKTASTSIEIALRRICGPDDIITPLTDSREVRHGGGRSDQNWCVHGWWQSPRPIWKRRWSKVSAEDYGFYKHMPAERAKALLGDEIWRSYFKFAFDRNPWDRQVSFYHYRYNGRRRPPSFAEFIYRDKQARLDNYGIYSIGGTVAVDFLGRFERLEEDLHEALRQAGLGADLTLPRAKADTGRNGASYRDYYDDGTRDVVAEWYMREIDLLNYEF
jgi:Sulfotransferase family